MDERFVYKPKTKDMIQYATLYWVRLQTIKPDVKEMAEIRWPKQDYETVNNILEIKPGRVTLIIGTLFKEMPLKPSILKNVLGILGTRKFEHGLYVGEEDYAVLEDTSGRIRIRKDSHFNPNHFVTGSILGLKGKVDSHGFFDVQDYCLAGIPYKESLPQEIKLDLKRGLYEDLEGREFIGFVSGLEFGSVGDVMTTEMLLRFVRGEMGDSKNALVSVYLK